MPPVPTRHSPLAASRLIAAAAFLAWAPLAAAKVTDPALPGEVLVKLQSSSLLEPLQSKYNLELLGQFGARPIYRLRAAASADTHDLLVALQAEPGVLIAEPNALHRSPEARKNVVWAIGSAADYASQWASQAIGLAAAHALSRGATIRVAVLDTGVDRSHPQLASRVLPGIDFVDGDLDPSEAGTTADAAYGHGTHVAGIIATTAPDAAIVPIRVLDAQGEGNAWILGEALLYAVDPDRDPITDDGAHVINLSLGSTSRTRLFDTLAQLVTCTTPEAPGLADDVSDPGYDGDKARCARHGGAVIVAAAGNEGSAGVREYPAAEGAYGTVSVTASARDGRLAPFANFGSWIDVAAPGDAVTSTVPGGGYGTWSGTSMAAPFVAGVAALIRARDHAVDAETVVRRLVRTSSPLCRTPIGQLDALAALLDRASDKPLCR